MTSAYLLLRVPGNASLEEIELAYRRAAESFPPQRLASDEGAVDRLNELKAAYMILCDPALRAAHDRKLAAAPAPAPARVPRPPLAQANEPSTLRNVAVWILIAAAALFAAASYVNQRREEARKAHAALELAQQQKAEREEQERAKEAERLQAERAAAKARQDADEKRFTIDSQQVARTAAMERERQERLAQAAQRSAEAQARLDEQRRANEARMQVERDKWRVRELCLQLYRRPDC